MLTLSKLLIVITILNMSISALSAETSKEDYPVVRGMIDETEFFHATRGLGTSSGPLISEQRAQTVMSQHGLSLACGQVKPKQAFKNYFNNINRGINDSYNELLMAVNGTMASIPGIIIQRANPNWYMEFRRLFAEATEKLRKAMQICERIAEKGNQYLPGSTESIFSNKAKQETLAKEVNLGADIITAGEKIESTTNAVRNGATLWCGRKFGGAGQPPLQLMAVPILIGYNHLLGRSCFDQSAYQPKGKTRDMIGLIFKSPGAAQEWARRTFGDETVAICRGDGCAGNENKVTQVERIFGSGLFVEVKRERELIVAALTKILNGEQKPSIENLSKITEYSAPIHLHVIENIKSEFEAHDRIIVVQRLADEIATQKVAIKARTILQLLHIGTRDPNVAAFYLEHKGALVTVSAVERELDLLERDIRLTQQIAYPYMQAILDFKKVKQTRAAKFLPVPGDQQGVFEKGAYKPLPPHNQQ